MSRIGIGLLADHGGLINNSRPITSSQYSVVALCCHIYQRYRPAAPFNSAKICFLF